MINNKEIELENKFIDNFRSILASLSHSIDKISEIDKKISLIELTHISFVMKILINLLYY